MGKATRKKLAEVAKQKAELPFHGFIDGQKSNLAPIIALFPKWNVVDADRLWCAAFVYYCCVEAAFAIPYSPDECVTCSLAGCGGWEEYAMGENRIEYYKAGASFTPEPGDIILYDRVFCNREHDHMGILLEVRENSIVAAEGNIFDRNISGIVERPINEQIRAYIRIPDGYCYEKREERLL